MVLSLRKISYQNCPWFPCFRICSVARNENPETPESTKGVLN